MDSRRMIFLMVFCMSMFMLWTSWQQYNAPKASTDTGSGAPIAATISDAAPPAGTSVDNAPSATNNAVPTDAKIQDGAFATVKTDLFTAKISSVGGNLVELKLNSYKDRDDKTQALMLLGDQHKYRAQSGLTSAEAGLLPDHNTLLQIEANKTDNVFELVEGQEALQLKFFAPEKNGVKVTKIYSFKRGSYLMDVTYEIDNNSAQAISPNAYFQLRRDGESPAGESRMSSTYTGAAVYSAAEKYNKIKFDDIEKGKVKLPINMQDGWVAMVQHYFVSAWIPAPNTERKYYARAIDEGNQKLFDAGLIVPIAPIAANSKGSLSIHLFAGPQTQSVLETLSKPVTEGGLGAEGLPLVVDYGWLTIVAAPIFWALQKLHEIIGNWGWSIIALTCIIKLIFFPLSAASYKSMAKMRTLTPKMTALRERYGEDKQKLNTEMMALYRSEKVNPLGGCLPIVIQIPVFIALYWALLGAVEMRDAPWALWIHDLSAADPYYILPLIMVGTMLLQTRLNPTPPDPVQAKIAKMMPLIFGVMFFWFPAGLVLYWCVNNTLSIAQQWQITRMIENKMKAANDS